MTFLTFYVPCKCIKKVRDDWSLEGPFVRGGQAPYQRATVRLDGRQFSEMFELSSRQSGDLVFLFGVQGE